MQGTFKIPESVLVVIHTPALDVLLIRRTDSGNWQSVTGSKDFPGELFQATAVREIFEETGIDCGIGSSLCDALQDWYLENVYDIYPEWRYRYAHGITRNTEHLFGLCVPRGTPIRLSPREHSDYQWLPWHEAADTCFSPSNAEAILLLPQFAR